MGARGTHIRQQEGNPEPTGRFSLHAAALLVIISHASRMRRATPRENALHVEGSCSGCTSCAIHGPGGSTLEGEEEILGTRGRGTVALEAEQCE